MWFVERRVCAALALAWSTGCRPHDWVQIGVGDGIICARRMDESAVCVGTNFAATPPSVAYSDLRTGYGVACGARAADGGVECWGDVAADMGPAPDGEFAEVHPCHDVDTTACAVTSSGDITCWGAPENPIIDEAPRGAWGDLTLGTHYGATVDEAGAPLCWGLYFSSDCGMVPNGREVADVEASGAGLCILYTDGSIDCQIVGIAAGAEEVPPGSYVAVATSSKYACGIRTDGELSCWGPNQDGYPMRPPPGRFVSVSAGPLEACAIDEGGELWCWGNVSMFEGIEDLARIWTPD